MKNKLAILSLSGGMDSSTLLLHLLSNEYNVIALSMDYNQKHRVELERAKELVNYINSKISSKVTHQIIKLDGLQNLLNSTLVEGGKEVPEGHYEQENMKETVVPNRNKIFSSIIQAVALSKANEINDNVVIAMGIHAGDFEVYPDTREDFRNADYKAFLLGNWGGERVTYYTPYLNVKKFEILQDGKKCCDKLGLDFNEVYKRTNTSYKPIQHSIRKGLSVEWEKKWYSDYKSAASVERIEAFIKLGTPDPVEYADENSPVSWDVAKTHVEKVLSDFKHN